MSLTSNARGIKRVCQIANDLSHVRPLAAAVTRFNVRRFAAQAPAAKVRALQSNDVAAVFIS
jgi:hypothetical protein